MLLSTRRQWKQVMNTYTQYRVLQSPILTLYSSPVGLYQILRGNIWLYLMLQHVYQLVTN